MIRMTISDVSFRHLIDKFEGAISSLELVIWHNNRNISVIYEAYLATWRYLDTKISPSILSHT